MADQLHDRQSLTGLAENKQVIEFASQIAEFERLAQSVNMDLSAQQDVEISQDWRARPVTGRLSFDVQSDGSEAVVLEAESKTTIPAVCQRCLGVFELPLAIHHQLLLGENADEADAQAEYEFWEVPGDTVRPVDIVDEALVMALPLSARHENAEDCVVVESMPDKDEKITPFATLRSLMDEEQQD